MRGLRGLVSCAERRVDSRALSGSERLGGLLVRRQPRRPICPTCPICRIRRMRSGGCAEAFLSSPCLKIAALRHLFGCFVQIYREEVGFVLVFLGKLWYFMWTYARNWRSTN